MCYCNPSIRTPFCGRPGCIPSPLETPKAAIQEIPDPSQDPEVVQRVVVCAAARYSNGYIVTSARHHDKLMNDQLRLLRHAYPEIYTKGEQGFIDQWGVFMNREEALEVAVAANQLNVRRPKSFPEHKLFSEDLY